MTNLIVMAIIITTNFYQAYDPIATSNEKARVGITNGYSIFHCTSNAVCCVATDIDIGMQIQETNIYLYTFRKLDRKCDGFEHSMRQHNSHFMYDRRSQIIKESDEKRK
jgi:hypothetical protein